VYSAQVDAANTLHTLSTFDELDGGDGDDTLEIYLDAAVTALTAAPEIQNIELIELYASGTIAVLDLSNADITGLEEIALVRITSAATVTVTLDDFTGVAIALDRVGAGTYNFVANDDNDTTLEISATSSGDTAGTAAVVTGLTAATVDAINLSVVGDNVIDFSAFTGVTAITINGSGSFDDLDSSTALTALVSLDASDLEGDLLMDIHLSTALTSVLGGAGADTISINVTADVTVDMGAGDDVLDITATTGVLDANDSLAGGAGTLDVLVIDVADLSAVTDDIVSGFEVIALGAGTAATTTLDFDDLSSDVTGLKFAGASATAVSIDNADGKTIFIYSSVSGLVINDDTTSDTVAIEINSADTAVTLTATTLFDIEEITIAAISDVNALDLGSFAIFGSDTVEISIADGDTGAGVTAGTVSVTSGDLVINISSDSVTVGRVSASGADTVEINVTGDTVVITALTSDAADVSISLGGDTNSIVAASLSGVTTLTITSAGDNNAVTALEAATLTDLTLEITGGDFTLVSGTLSVLLESITISGAGDITSVVVDAASTAFGTLDLSDFTGEIAAGGIDLSAVIAPTTGVDVTFGELTGATAATAIGQLLLGATNSVSDTIEFTVDFDGFIMIANFEGGGNILNDNIDLSAFVGSTADLTITDDGTDTTISAADYEFSFSIVLTGVTAGSLAGSDFIF
jgi:hypothetical protein